MLVAARSVECDPGRNPAFLPRTRLYVPQSARAPGADAQHGRPHRLDGRGDGDRGFPCRRAGEDRGPAGPSGGRFPRNHVAVLRNQREVQRLHRRPGTRLLPGQGSHHRADGGAAVQGRTQVVLSDQFGAGVRTLQGRARLRRPDGKRDFIRPLHRHGYDRQLLCGAVREGRGRGVRARGHRGRPHQFDAERHREYGVLCWRYESRAERRVHTAQRPSRRHHPRPAACRSR